MPRPCSENEFCHCASCRVINGMTPRVKPDTLLRIEPGLFRTRDGAFEVEHSWDQWMVSWTKTEGDTGRRTFRTFGEARSFAKEAHRLFKHVRR